ncbi:hypothetical protein NQ036_14410 [Brevibacterium sp. 91QC2O2]|uniref:hypothetical protein n=1 Tax=Brevibacterium TaxID=1696 RepID=UPI00211B95DB|nr:MULTISPECIES: hypothetical protein [unclassified Brevibacterium]MCQ9369427.1 hypothetical protein [Brevibacterium sp. 91QC2O2]MCQ9386776.1 hypothetical protein [Brevibacterium sp. 68QC2CO]
MTHPAPHRVAAQPLWHFIRGPRAVDLPIRLLLLGLAIALAVLPNSGLASVLTMAPGTPLPEPAPTGALPTDPVPTALRILASALLICAGFAPLAGGCAAGVAAVGFALAWPHLVSPLLDVVTMCAVLLLSFKRWWSAGVLAVCGLALTAVFGRVPAEHHIAQDLASFLGTLAVGALFAWGVCIMDARIERDARAREADALAHQRELDRVRLQAAMDTHDSVTHGLTTESLVIRHLIAEARETGRDTADLVELALINARTVQELRLLLAKLRAGTGYGIGGPTPDQSGPEAESEAWAAAEFARALERGARAMEGAAEASGFKLRIVVGELPQAIPHALAAEVIRIVQELVTNMIRHGTSASGAEPHSTEVPGTETSDAKTNGKRTGRVEVGRAGPAAGLLIRAANPCAAEALGSRPRTVAGRAAALGGTCAVEVVPGAGGCEYTVTVVLPLGSAGEPAGGADLARRADLARSGDARGTGL